MVVRIGLIRLLDVVPGRFVGLVMAHRAPHGRARDAVPRHVAGEPSHGRALQAARRESRRGGEWRGKQHRADQQS